MLQPLVKTIELLISLIALTAEEAYEKIKDFAPKYIKWLLATTAIWFFAIFLFALLKAFTGILFFGYIMAILTFMFTIVLGISWFPLGTLIGMLLGHTVDPGKAGGRYLRAIGTIFFIMLMVSIYVMRVPMHKNPASILPLILCACAVTIGSMRWGGFFSGRFYTFIAVVTMFLITLSFFFPETFHDISKKFDGLDSAIARAIREPHASIQKPDQISPQAKQTKRPEPQRQSQQKYSLPRAEKTQPVAERNDAQARKQQIEKAAADSARKARADSTKLALAREKSPQYIKAKLDSARAAQESLCVALERQYKYK